MANEKAALYKEILQHADEYVILERMQENGFWPYHLDVPADPPAEIKERAELEKRIAELRRTGSKVKDPDKALAAERKRRWEESKQRRKANKLKRIAEAKARREAWAKAKATLIAYAGEGVSGGLSDTKSDAEALAKRGLPVLHTGAEVAKAIGIPLAKLRWLTYHRRGATVVHYHRFGIPKKTGGIRSISAPKRSLAHAQQWVLGAVLDKLTPEPEAHGFVSQRSIVTNATPHVGRAVVVNMDLRDFFPTITFRRVKGLFHGLGYSENVATVLALLCTEPPRVAAEVDGKLFHVALGARMLPQGACTSPAITNALCRRLDRRVAGLAKRHGFAYTRYADDLTFSGDKPTAVGRLLRSVRSILVAEGFTEHPDKTRVMRKTSRQEVTGVTVNTRTAVARDEVRTLRAILHNAARHGLASQNREGREDFAAYLRGRVAFVAMVDPQRGEALRAALAKALERGA